MGHYTAYIYGVSSITGGLVGLSATNGFDNVDNRAVATVSVQGYSESKSDFIVSVAGNSQTKTIRSVRIAAWSDENGQDDLKWYTPEVRNNQAQAQISIQDLSNTTDNYQVHVYTEYTDGTTVGTNLGSYKITKPASTYTLVASTTDYGLQLKLDSDAIDDYSKVRFAVWSDKNGQDDLKWYAANANGEVLAPFFRHSDAGTVNVHIYQVNNGQTTGLLVDTVTLAQSDIKNTSSKLQSLLSLAESYIGTMTNSITHKALVDAYNVVKPLPVNYEVKYSDDWCDVFVTTMYQSLNLSDLIGRECGVQRHINIMNAKNIWFGKIDTPKVGDIITYDWNGDNFADHIGIVSAVANGMVTTIEGNTLQSSSAIIRGVHKKQVSITSSQIKGFVRPNY